MRSVGLGADDIGSGDAGSQDWEGLLQNFDQDCQDSKNMSFAEINAKRKQLTFHAFKDPAMMTRIAILEDMVAPNTQLMDKLFKRSGWISSLYHLPRHDQEKRAELMERPGISWTKPQCRITSHHMTVRNYVCNCMTVCNVCMMDFEMKFEMNTQR